MKPVILSPVTYRLLTLMIFMFVPLSIIAPHAVVWEVIIGGLIGAYYNRQCSLTELPQSLIAILIAIPLWGLVTTLWSINPMASLLMSLKIFALVVLGIYWCRLTLSLPQDTQKSLIRALIGGLCLGIVFLFIDKLSGNTWQTLWAGSSAKAFAKGSLIISLVTWPVILWILQRPYSLLLRFILVTCLLFSIFWTLFQIDCDTSFIGLFLGNCIFIGTLFFPRLASWGMRLLVPLVILSFPVISLKVFKPEYISLINTYIHSPSYLDRLYIWNDVASSIFEHPWGGIGMDGTPHHEKGEMVREWSYIDEQGIYQKMQSTRFGMHPHNVILQLWLELGYLGVILGTLLAHLILLQVYCTNLKPVEKAVCAGLFTGIFLIIWVNLGFWQNWWVSGLWIIVGLTITLFKSKREAYETIFA